MREKGFPGLAIHGDKSQQERDWVLDQFRNGKARIMIATGVASRGLDVKGVNNVINYDAPGAAEDYVHRVGRTGRAGAKGDAYTFLTPQKAKIAPELVELLARSNQPIPPELSMLARSTHGSGAQQSGGKGRRW